MVDGRKRDEMNQEQQLNQALRLTVNELTTQLANEVTTKNMLAVQLTEANQQYAELQARVTELETLLEAQTNPAEEQKGE